MPDTKQFAEIVKQAEQAVKGVSDPELRRVAFEKILTALIEKTDTGKGTRKKSQRTSTLSHSPPTKKGRGPMTYVRELIDDGFFSKPKSISQVKAELENRGHHIAVTNLSGPMQSLCKEKSLRRQKTKALIKGGKERQTYTYSEW
jgi:nitrogen fixation/metabolism regulation signal transduction histidine kinase